MSTAAPAFPGDHPDPPADLTTRHPIRIEEVQAFYRLHRTGKRALYFGRGPASRFDAPDRSFGVLYVGCDIPCAFVETFGQQLGRRYLTASELKQRDLSRVVSLRPLTLIDIFTSGGLARIGADSRLFSGAHAKSQLWAKALHDLAPAPDGILYPARHDPARCACALFDHVEPAISVTSLGSLNEVQHRGTLADLLDLYDFGYVDDTSGA